MRAITDSGMAVWLAEDGTWVAEEQTQILAKEGFRKSPWGASLCEVKAAEAQEPRQERDDYLDFEVKLGSFSCRAVFIFVGDKLVRGKYRILDDYQNPIKYLSVYDELRDSVSKKYGSVIEDKSYWLNDLYKSDYREWGMAVARGHLSKFALWETSESKITLGLLGERSNVSVVVEYAGKAFDGVEEAAKEASLLGDL